MSAITSTQNRAATGHSKSEPIFHRDMNMLKISGSSVKLMMSNFHFSMDKILDRQLDQYGEINLQIVLNKLNKVTLKGLFDLFKSLGGHQRLGKTLHVEWLVNDNQEILQTAYELSELYEIDIELKN